MRANFRVESDGTAVLRMMDDKGTIRVKLGASEDGSGLVLVNGNTELGAQLLAKNNSTFLKVRNDPRESVIKP